MLESLFLNEFTTSKLLLRESSLEAVKTILTKLRGGEKIQKQEFPLKNISGMILPDDGYEGNPYDELEENSVAIIPLIGMMTKYGYWWRPGCDDMANMIRLADQSSKIIGTILLANTPGGTSSSVMQLEDALRNRKKPSVGLIDGQCCSGGIYVLSFCNQILAVNRMCEIGSIGVYRELQKDDKYYQQIGLEFIDVYPPESKYKNLAVREALQNKPDRLIKEDLTPFAVHFQNIIKEGRPNLDLTVEGIIEGKVFYAYDAIQSKLIDNIMNIDQAVELVHTLSNQNQSIFSPFKNFNS